MLCKIITQKVPVRGGSCAGMAATQGTGEHLKKEDCMLTKPYRRYVFPFSLLVLFLFLASMAKSDRGTEDYLGGMGVSRVKENVDAPHFILPDLEKRQRSLREFKGKFVILNFWATW